MSVMTELVEELESLTEGENWELSLDTLLGILGISREDYYRVQYARRKRFGMNVDGFGPENVDRLIEVLGDFGYNDSGEILERAGYWFNPDRLEEWQEFFLSVTAARLSGHNIDRDELENALSACRNPSDGIEFYCETRFELEELIAFAANLFLKKHGIEAHTLSRGKLEGFLCGLYAKRILKKEDIFESLHETLIERALDWKFLKEAEVRKKVRLPEDIARCLRMLELPVDEEPETETIKKQYRTLLKKYHPDVNPAGLERTRDINSAYTALVLGLQTQSRRPS